MFGKFSRRDFAKLAGLSALGLATAPPIGCWRADNRSPLPRRFPEGFVWGTATSAYQIEGAVDEDGRGRSIWDTFAHTPGKIADHSNADRANDHYHRYKEDVRLIKALGRQGLSIFDRLAAGVSGRRAARQIPRVSISTTAWSMNCWRNGIEPYATLYHWDLPQPLQDHVGGWQSSDTSKAFGDLCGLRRGALERSGQEYLHGQRSRKVREFRLWLGHRCPRPQTADRRN